jgi:hypothetical protein
VRGATDASHERHVLSLANHRADSTTPVYAKRDKPAAMASRLSKMLGYHGPIVYPNAGSLLKQPYHNDNVVKVAVDAALASAGLLARFAQVACDEQQNRPDEGTPVHGNGVTIEPGTDAVCRYRHGK